MSECNHQLLEVYDQILKVLGIMVLILAFYSSVFQFVSGTRNCVFCGFGFDFVALCIL